MKSLRSNKNEVTNIENHIVEKSKKKLLIKN